MKLIKIEKNSNVFKYIFEEGDEITLYEETPLSSIWTDDGFLAKFDGDKRDLPENWEYEETEGAGIWYITVRAI